MDEMNAYYREHCHSYNGNARGRRRVVQLSDGVGGRRDVLKF